ncbi:MAG: PorV/PorQ family protein [Candidatus Krumholzibacteriia bacterium]
MSNIIRHRLRGFALGLTLVAGWVVCGPGAARAQDATGGVPGDWLSRYMGARTAGLGGAFVAAADDPTAAVWNPAGLSLVAQNTVHFETATLFESTSLHGLSLAIPSQRLASFGLTILNLRSGGFERTNEFNQPLGEFAEGDMAFLFSASRSLSPRLSLGANVKVVRQTVETFNGTGAGFDLGALYSLTPTLRLGVSLLNLGGPSVTLRATEETFPMEVRGGLALQFMNGRGLASIEFDHRSGPGATFHGGSEFLIHRTMTLRVGYADTSPTGGFTYRVSPDLFLDYAAADQGLGVTHRFGITYRFGGFFASSRAVPSVFSPIGQQSVTRFQLRARTRSQASSWSLEITDKSSQVVRRFGGKGVPPPHVMWDGKDETGLPLADGTYRYQLVVVDVEGREFTGHQGTVEITTGGPQGSVPVFTD